MMTEYPPDSYLRYRRDLNWWAFSPTLESWPGDMDATTCGDWIERASAVLGLLELPETIRKVLMQRLDAGAHYCRKWDRVQDYNFADGDLELVQSLAGSYPEDGSTT
jgi:hypothetical protein